MTIIKVDFL